MYKTNIRIIVQGADECAADFAKYLEGECYKIQRDLNPVGTILVLPTSSANGRQTITLQWQTNESRDEALFSLMQCNADPSIKSIGEQIEEKLIDKDIQARWERSKLVSFIGDRFPGETAFQGIYMEMPNAHLKYGVGKTHEYPSQSQEEIRKQIIQVGQFQKEVNDWMLKMFGETITSDKHERNVRFLEECLELVQSLGLPKDVVHKMVNHTYAKVTGMPDREVGDVMITLAALCNPNGINIEATAWKQFQKAYIDMDNIRERQKRKPKYVNTSNQYDEGEWQQTNWTTAYKTYQLCGLMEYIHVLHNALMSTYLVIAEDASGLNLDETMVGTKEEVERRFRIEL